jgi:tryptophan-rich sensory protein
MMLENPRSLKRDLLYAVVAVASVVGASIVGQLATYPNLEPWYAGLNKPMFNPPSWVFAPAWTGLYLLMAFAVWRVLRLRVLRSGRREALIVFFTQLLLNAAWPWMFFGANSPLLGLINIVPQLVAILWALGLFLRLDRIAGWCLVPLAAWVVYATALNFSIWRLNT